MVISCFASSPPLLHLPELLLRQLQQAEPLRDSVVRDAMPFGKLYSVQP